MIALAVVPLGLVVAGIGHRALSSVDSSVDLQLIAPTRAERGQRVGARTYFFESIGKPYGPETAEVDVTLTVADENGLVFSQTSLDRSHVTGSEGSFVVPVDAPRRLLLTAEAKSRRDERIRVRRFLEVHEHAPPQRSRARDLPRLQSFHPVSTVQAKNGRSLWVRVEGGGCVLESPCSVLIRCDREGAEVTASMIGGGKLASVEPLGNAIHRAVLVVQGPEAQLEVVAAASQEPLETQRYQLPILVSGLPFEAPRRVGPGSPSIALSVRAKPERFGALVDVFHQGQWIAATSVKRSSLSVRLPDLPARSELMLQVRLDPFGLESIVSHAFRISDRVSPLEAFELAGREVEIFVLPQASHSREQALERASFRSKRLRIAATLVLVLSGLLVIVLVASIGIRSSLEARDLLSLGGAPPSRIPARSLLRTMTLVLMVGLAIAAAIVLALL